ncbi:hypothetical protein [Sphingobacterium suaedae]|uniref:Uncharacterized protein n=1 Tax=Sphingobacterium suaedae TaxID=1686402 RepID=A0ABW5KPG7_9SPHI
MKTKKIMGIFILVIIGGAGLFLLLLFVTTKTKSSRLDTYPPFDTWVGKTVSLTRDVVLFQEQNEAIPNSAYSYLLSDSLHPNWPSLAEGQASGSFDLQQILSFPAGTLLTLEKAIQYTNGVSGFSTPILFGHLTGSDGHVYPIYYPWGSMNMEKRFDNVDACWKFHQAPWQKAADSTFYALPDAKFW